MPYTEKVCCDDGKCVHHKIFKAKNFSGLLEDGQYQKCHNYLKADPSIVWVMTYDSISCGGYTGLYVFQRVGYLLQEGMVSATDKAYKTLALEVVKCLEEKDKTPWFPTSVRVMYALASNQKAPHSNEWLDVLRSAINEGTMEFSMKGDFAFKPISPEMQAVWDSWKEKESETCCICMDAVPDAFFHPCNHHEYCFECLSLCKECPVCRISGHAKRSNKSE